ncbi:D-2-hydroxyglutaric acid dehydrogenase isoform X2 [Arctopsyche grandis]
MALQAIKTFEIRLIPFKNFIKHSIRPLSSLPEFSKNKYNVKRKSFNLIEDAHVSFFQNLLGKERVLTDESELLSYNIDWIKNCRGESRVVLKPKCTEHVSAILKFCNDNNLAVCPQGGNTGLVGGSVPVFDEIVLSTEGMNNIISLDEISGVLVCEAGCILENLDNHLREHNLMMPLDLGAKGSCHIGGNISTNAGGLRLLRYGNLHGSVLGVEAVKADGEVIDCLGTLKKDNTGYHLKHLFIGSEGTLGIVTKVSINCPTLSSSINVAFLGVENFDNVLKLYQLAKSSLGEIMSAFEMADAASLETTIEHLKLQNPIGDYPFYVLIETSGSNESHDSEKLTEFLEKTMSSNLVLNGTYQTEPSRIKPIWALREGIPQAILYDGYVLKYDISLPLKDYYSIVPIMREKLGSDAVRICGYGHIGDGNIHVNIAIKEFSQEIIKKIEPYIYEYTSNLKGSVSAEHGIGFRKPNYIHYSKSNACLGLMKSLKNLMDPKGILNPYKVLPS